MGVCCFRDNKIVKPSHNQRMSKLKSCRSSIYQINKENINDVYEISSKVSSGYYGTVSMACFKNDPSKFYAVKSISKTNLSMKSLRNLICEIQILAKLDHPNIVKYYETYDDDKYFHLVMELCEGGELFQRIVSKKHLEEKDAAEILFKLTHAISHCHSRGIVHRDIKAENVLFETKSKDKNDVKIIDFGLARKKVDHTLHSIVGTPGYVAPEVLEGTYGRKCDIWALGVLLYVMLYGKYPFDDDNTAILFEKIRTKEPRYDRREVSQEAIELMKEMLCKDPEMRPEATEILDHPWFMLNLKNEFKDSIKDLEMIPRLKSFKAPNAFMKKILGFLVKEVNSAEVDELNNKFYILDEKKNGVVDIAKYKSHIDPAMLSNVNTINERKNIDDDSNENLFSDCVLKKFIKTEPIGLSQNRKIDYTSFMAANLIDRNLITKDTVKTVFNRFDIDCVGYLTIKGFHKALRRTGKKISEKDTEKMLSEAGFENPDYITYEEFMTIVGDFLWA